MWVSAQTVNSFTVVNADTGADMATFTSSGTVSVGSAPNINVRANASDVKSVIFSDATTTRTENGAPYSYKGDSSGSYFKWAPASGIYVINAKPFSGPRGSGTAGPVATLILTITNTPAPDPAPATLSVNVSGSGSVSSSPSAINCGSVCSAPFVLGTSVTLRAVPASGSSFKAWGGACAGRASTCTVAMSTARSVTAAFDLASSTGLSPTAVLGKYQRDPFENGTHCGTIAFKGGSTTELVWTNQAGTSWNLFLDPVKALLLTDSTNPFFNLSAGHRSFELVQFRNQVTGFRFNGELYSKTISIADVLGEYRKELVANGWHAGSISLKPGSTTALRWTNQAGISWDLTPDFANKLLRTDASNPYQDSPGGKDFALTQSNGVISGFRFFEDRFAKVGVGVPTSVDRRMSGYTGASYAAAIPSEYTAGFSFYSAIWPLTDKPLARFQVGLPGTWLMPDNSDFTQPLLPPENPARIEFPERGPTWASVFQTIEGSGGSWVTTQFPSSEPKYRMNGTANGYIDQVSSPGWGFGGTTALPANAMGLAQLSNRLLVPPDGLTFNQQPAGEMLGKAWMALPLIPAIDNAGDQSWTLFLNASNFKGPVAFYIPQLWARYSKRYPTIVGRGLDVRPGRVGPPTMEFGEVPTLLQTSGDGQVYARIPRLQFPISGNGISYLAADMAVYSKTAIFSSVSRWLSGGSVATPIFNVQGRYLPPLQVNGTSPQFDVADTGKAIRFSSVVQAKVFTTTNGKQAFGMQWSPTSTQGTLPEFFVQKTDGFEPIAVDQLPSDISLRTDSFRPANNGLAYTSSPTWNTPAPATASTVVTLSDGTTVRYAWYKFVDQPSVQGFGWTAAQKAAIQARIEKIHASWATTPGFMDPPSTGVLTTLDPNLLVIPPAGKSIGYVPIVTEQWKP
jgi:Divergent InlB B-repeat domain